MGCSPRLMPKRGGIARLDRPDLFRPVEPSVERDSPGSLVRAVAADGGGVWQTGDWYVEPDRIVERVRKARTRGLRVDARDVTFLRNLPELRFLWLATDGIPVVDPLASLPNLEALIVHTAGMRGAFTPFLWPCILWLRVSLGGKVGRTIAERLSMGHPDLECLWLTEIRQRSIAE